MRVGIVGSRNFGDMEKVREFVKKLCSNDVIISGGCRGVDRVGVEEGRKRGLKCIEIMAEWERYGKGSGMIRNKELIKEVDKMVIFWDGGSKGSKNMIDLCRNNRINYEVIYDKVSLWD